MVHITLWDEVQVDTSATAASVEGDTADNIGLVQYVTYPKGILDENLWEHCDTIAQQTNCIGCRGAGMAKDLAEALPYGCPYATKRPILPAKRFAIPNDRTTPGTIQVRLPWTKRTIAQTVINMFAQWELGRALKYNRIACPQSFGKDTAEDR